MTKPDRTKPQPVSDATLDQVKGGGAAWHELVVLGDVAPATKGGPHVKVFGGRSG